MASSIQVIAQQADDIFDTIMKFEPTAAMIASAVIPGAAPVIAMVQPEIMLLAPAIDQALETLKNGDNPLTAVMQLMMHITQGMPNAPALSPTPIVSAPAAESSTVTGDASQQGGA